MKNVFTLSLLFIASLGYGQWDEPVLPGMEGQALIDQLVQNYKPNFTLTNTASKDTLYARIYRVSDSVSCVYTGFRVPLDPGDPSQAVFAYGINLEHTYPKSKGTDNNQAEADMHHLYPTLADVNGDRASLPFADIPDGNTDTWYYLDQEQSGIQSSNIDLYSEVVFNEHFEAREDHKGNIARAMFYVYTMYNSEVTSADPDFFAEQLETLCQWHLQDPVDQLEWERSWKIAEYQDGQPNPFVLDCTLAYRAYCQGITEACQPTGVFVAQAQISNAQVAVLGEELQVQVQIEEPEKLQIVLLDLQGKVIQTFFDGVWPVGNQAKHYSLVDYPHGLYVVRIQTAHGQYAQRIAF